MTSALAVFRPLSRGAISGQQRRGGFSPLWSLLWLLIACLLVWGCGGSSSAQQPSPSDRFGFLYSDGTSLLYLSWQENGRGGVTGQELRTVVPQPLTAQMIPATRTVHVSGEDNNGLVTLSLAIAAGSSPLSGTLSGGRLLVNATDASGRVVTQQWVAAGRQDVTLALAAFSAYLQLSGALTDLRQLVLKLPADSDPASLDATVTLARQYVRLLQARLALLQVATSQVDRCRQLALFSQYYPAAPETFQLPYAPENSTLHRELQAAAARWDQAKTRVLPHVAGFSPPWVLSPQAVADATAPGQRAYAALAAAYSRDQQEMARLHTDYQRVGNAVAPLQQGC